MAKPPRSHSRKPKTHSAKPSTKPPAGGKVGDPSGPRDVIRTLPKALQVPDGLMTKVVGALLSLVPDGKPPADRLMDVGLNQQQAFGVLRSARLGDLTGGHLPLVRSLQLDNPDDASAALEDLAAWGHTQWVQRVKETGVPKQPGDAAGDSGIAAYAETLRRRIEQSHPTPFIAARIADGRIALDAAVRPDVQAFLSSNPAFRIGETGVVAHFLSPDALQLEKVSKESVPNIQRALMRIERAVKIAPSLEHAESLLRAGYDAAGKVLSRSREAFVKEVGHTIHGGADAALDIYERAHTATAAVAALVVNYSPQFNAGTMAVIPPPQAPLAKSSTSNLPPTLRTLFGSTDYCECCSCTSLTSAAAYFVDLLHTLGSGAKNVQGKTPLDVLLERRPDLAEIDLTCENTDTLIPYIDLALEVLERPLSSIAWGLRVARGPRRPDGSIVDYGYDVELDKGDLAVAPAELLDELAIRGITLSTRTRVARTRDLIDAIGTTIRRWVLRDDGWKVYLSGYGSIPAAYVVEAWPQSHSASRDSSGVPPLALAGAYNNLRTARFPWTLPFDIAPTAIELWLRQLGVERHSLIEAFAGGGRWQSVDAACAVLGIGAGERAILTTPITAPYGNWKDWGFDSEIVAAPVADPIAGVDRPQGRWVDLLKWVSLLRTRAGLTHRELLNVLGTRFVQSSPGLVGALEMTGDECDTAAMRMERLNDAALRRVHLFVRVWRKLGWSVFDVDRAIDTYGIPSAASGSEFFPPSFLVFLGNLVRLTTSTGLSVQQLLCLFRSQRPAKLDTFSYWDWSGATPQRAPSTLDSLFNSRTVSNPGNPAFTADATDPTRLKRVRPPQISPWLTFPALRLSDYVSVLSASLSVSSHDILALLPEAETSIAPVKLTAAVTGASVAISGATRKTVEIVIGACEDAGAQITLQVQDSSDGTTFSPVAAAGLPAVLTSANGWSLMRWDYPGSGNFLRVSVTALQGVQTPVWLSARILTTAGVVQDELSLDNLSAITRDILFARCVRLPAADALRLKDVSGIDPFSGPDALLQTLDAMARLRAAGLTIKDLDDVLLHRFEDDAAAKRYDLQAVQILSGIRVGLQSLWAETSTPPDKSIDLTRKLLVEIGWDHGLIDTVYTTGFLNADWTDYVAPLDLATLPIRLPSGFSHDPRGKTLSVGGTVRPAQLLTLVADLRQGLAGMASAAALALDAALVILGTRARAKSVQCAGLRALMRCLRLPTFSTAFTSPIDIPAKWQGRFFRDVGANRLVFVGWMTADERSELASLRPLGDTAYQNALAALFTLGADFREPDAANLLVVEESSANTAAGRLSAEAILLDRKTLASRCARILSVLAPVIRRDRGRQLIVERVAPGLGLDADVTRVLLSLSSSGGPPALDVLRDEILPDSDPASPVSRAAFPAQVVALIRALKLATLVQRLNLTSTQIPWLSGAWDGIDLAGLPVNASAAPASRWSDLQELLRICAVRDRVPLGTDLIEAMQRSAAMSSLDGCLRSIADTLSWDVADLRVVCGARGLNVSLPTEFRRPQRIEQLLVIVLATQKLGASFNSLLKWLALPGPATVSDAESVRQAVRAHYDSRGWNEFSRPVLDRLRIARRNALVAFLVQRKHLADANGLFGNYLIDAEMGSCMMTSRIVQATNTVQLFVQRCLLALEPDVAPDAINKDRQSVMGRYRVWEANRKVLLHPENWIEPDLRNDRTPLFDDTLGALLQEDATSTKAELALVGYLDRLRGLSNLEVAGMYREDHADRTVTVHVFGRTRSTPRHYYYRTYTETAPGAVGAAWTAWKPVDLDIEGDHLVPVVWNSRLYLFWLISTEKAPPVTAIAGPPAPPQKILEIKIAWSEYRRSSATWTSRRMSNPIFPPEWSLRTGHPSGALNTLFLQSIAAKMSVDFVLSHTEPGPPSSAYAAVWSGDRYYTSRNVPMPLLCLRFDGQQIFLVQSVVTVDSPQSLEFRPTGNGDEAIDASTYAVPVFHDSMAILEAWTAGDSWVQLKARGSSSTAPPLKLFVTPESAGRSRRLVHGQQEGNLEFFAPSAVLPSLGGRRSVFFYSDHQRSFFVYPSYDVEIEMQGWFMNYKDAPRVSIFSFDYPHIRRFDDVVQNPDLGVEGLYTRHQQIEPPYPAGAAGSFSAADRYLPAAATSLLKRVPSDAVPFDMEEPGSPYSWELFFHLPFAVACGLSKNHRFEEARRWFHFVFDPTDSSSDPTPSRFWRFLPFFNTGPGLRIEELVRRLADQSDQSPEKRNFQMQVAIYRNAPFQPHLLARLRPRAYMMAVAMRYLDNLIAWGDQLFRRETMESLNEAAQVYVLAAQLLGRRPEGIPRRTRPKVAAYVDLAAGFLDDLSNELVDAENLVPSVTVTSTGSATASGSPLPSLYFCVPPNTKLAGYYDAVDDRLFKLRNCMDIDGVVRQLPLFEPPIDPGLLVRAAAAGIDIASVLADSNAPLPRYRFSVMVQKASELAAEVKSLGAAVLGAIEKRDAEALARLRSGHEGQLLQAIQTIKQLQIEEGKTNIQALGCSLDSAQARLTHYLGLIQVLESVTIPTGPAGSTIASIASAALETIGKAATVAQAVLEPVEPITAAATAMIKQTLSRASEAISASLPAESGETSQVPMNPAEKAQFQELRAARALQAKAMDQRLLAQVLSMIPDFTLGSQGIASPVVIATLGGSLLSSMANFHASILDSQASEHTYRASLQSTLGIYQRRAAEWEQQARLAANDIRQITTQISAAGLRLAVAAQELRNHGLQMDHSREVNEFMHDKYSNQELYGWMTGQISSVHWRGYQLAYDVAKRAERTFRRELGLEDSNYIQFGYWDSQKQGLLAGEQLHLDIKRMDAAYLDLNKREYEITKHVSIASITSSSSSSTLLSLRASGACEVTLDESLFDFDCPGHYMRRIKSVSLTIPCVAGPYAGVNCKLTLLKSSVRHDASATRSYPRDDGNGQDTRFTDYVGAIESIVTSTGQNDGGLFETNLRDERYLPFEGAGAVNSRWRIELPATLRQFDYDTIADVILHIRYTAREGGEPLRQNVQENLSQRLLQGTFPGQTSLFSMRHDFPTEWSQFKSAAATAAGYPLEFVLKPAHYPYWAANRLTTTLEAELFVRGSSASSLNVRLDGAASADAMQLGQGLASKILVRAKPLTPTGKISWRFSDKSMNEIWLLLRWKQGT